MKFRPTFNALLAVLASSATTLHAGLHWEASEVERGVSDGSASLEIPFTFTVEGDKPVQIRKVDSDCGCTVARPEKREYAPGETGRIVATFTPGERHGTQEKHLSVLADDQTAPHKLVFRVKLPDLVGVDLRQIVWKSDEEPVAKRIRLTAASGLALKLKPLPEAQAARVRVELVPGEQSGESVLVVTPVGAAGSRAPALIPVSIHTLRDGKLVSPLTLFARLQR